MELLPLELSFQILSSLTTRQVLTLQLVNWELHNLARAFLVQAKAIEFTSMFRVVKQAITRLLPQTANLRSIDLSKCYKLTVHDVASVVQLCPKLQAIHLDGCLLNDTALVHLTTSNLPLRALSLRGGKYSQARLKTIPTRLPLLQYLDLSECEVAELDAGPNGGPHDNLRILDLSRTKVSGEALKNITTRFPRLFHLYLEGCSHLSAEGLLAIFSSSTLSLLSLNLSYNWSTTDQCVGGIAKMLPNLRSLELESCSAITDDGVAQLAAHCPKLESLQLGQCFKLTDRSLVLLAASCPLLRLLQINGCRSITKEGVAAFVGQLPRCCVVHEKGRRKTYRFVLPDDPIAPLDFM